jgi:hypothetical protein
MRPSFPGVSLRRDSYVLSLRIDASVEEDLKRRRRKNEEEEEEKELTTLVAGKVLTKG